MKKWFKDYVEEKVYDLDTIEYFVMLSSGEHTMVTIKDKLDVTYCGKIFIAAAEDRLAYACKTNGILIDFKGNQICGRHIVHYRESSRKKFKCTVHTTYSWFGTYKDSIISSSVEGD